MKRFLFLIVLVMLASSIMVCHRSGKTRPAIQSTYGQKQLYVRESAGEAARRHVFESRQQTRRALEEARVALAEARDEVRHALDEVREDVRTAFADVHVALVSDDDTQDGRRSDAAPTAAASQEVDDVPVPIVPGTRVTEAEATPPVHPEPVARVHPPAPPAPPAIAAVPAPTTVSVPQLVIGRLSATKERAVADANQQLRSRVAQWLDPEVPGAWSPPVRLVDAMILGKPQIRKIQKDYGELFEATLTVDNSPERRHTLIEVYNRQVVERRMLSLGGALAFVLTCLAAVSGYVRADEATKGYYTNRLRLLSAAGVGAAGVIIYHMVA